MKRVGLNFSLVGEDWVSDIVEMQSSSLILHADFVGTLKMEHNASVFDEFIPVKDSAGVVVEHSFNGSDELLFTDGKFGLFVRFIASAEPSKAIILL